MIAKWAGLRDEDGEGEREGRGTGCVCVCVCHSGIPHANQAEDFQMAEEQVEEIGSLKQKKKKRRSDV